MKSITKELLVQSAIAILSIASRILNETYMQKAGGYIRSSIYPLAVFP